MKKILFAIIAMLTFTSACRAYNTLPVEGEWVKPSNPLIQYIGRINDSDHDQPTFNWPGIEIRARFQGTSLRMVAKPKSGYFMCTIDNATPFKVAFNSERDSVVQLATALSQGEHSVRLMYTIEGLDRHAVFRGFVLDKGCKLVAPAPLPKRKIEFIGNSITCGYGVEDTQGTDHYIDETENHWLSYATLTSEALGAQHFSVSRSGIGAYRNYGGPTAGSPDAMPQMYDLTLYHDSTQQWDFKRWTPDVVCINLGTNDFSTPGYDAALYEKAYLGLVRHVRNCYPQAFIVLMSGPMLPTETNAIVKKALDNIKKALTKKGDKRICRFDFTPQDGSLGYGADFHPSKAQHQKMAEELTKFLQENIFKD